MLQAVNRILCNVGLVVLALQVELLKPENVSGIQSIGNEKMKYLTLSQLKNTPDIQVCNSDGTVNKITKLDFNITREVMGIFQAPNGRMNGQLEKMEAKILDFTSILNNKYLPSRSVWKFFCGKFCSSISHPLPSMSMTIK